MISNHLYHLLFKNQSELTHIAHVLSILGSYSILVHVARLVYVCACACLLRQLSPKSVTLIVDSVGTSVIDTVLGK